MRKSARFTIVLLVLVCALTLGLQSVVFAQEGSSPDTKPAGLTGLAAERVGYQTINLSWDPMPGAVKYVVYRSTKSGGGYQAVKATAATSFKNSKLTTGKVYYYKVQPYTAAGAGELYGPVKAKASLDKASRLKASSPKAGAIKVSWQRVPGANKYIVYRSRTSSGGFKAISVVKSKASYLDKSAGQGNTYYYKIVPCRNSAKGPAGTPKSAKSKVSAPVQAFLKAAESHLGKTYVLGGKGPDIFDCSGLIYYALNQSGYKIGYMTSHGWCASRFPNVRSFNDLQAGDILCRPGHVAIYAGDNMVIEAVHAGVSKHQYWGFKGAFSGAKRIF